MGSRYSRDSSISLRDLPDLLGDVSRHVGGILSLYGTLGVEQRGVPVIVLPLSVEISFEGRTRNEFSYPSPDYLKGLGLTFCAPVCLSSKVSTFAVGRFSPADG